MMAQKRSCCRVAVFTLFFLGCSSDGDSVDVEYEGDEAGECNDDADNDMDGLFDCNDPGCIGSEICGGSNDDSDEPVGTTDDGAVDVPEGWLTVSGNGIYYSDGTPFMGRGANIHDTRGCNACAYSEPNVDEVKRRIDALVDDWGANFMRLLLESYASADGRVHWANPLEDSDFLGDVVEMVDYIGSKPGVYVLLTLWIDPTFDDIGWPTDETIPVWEVLAEALVDQPHVMFGLVNEPESNVDGALDGEVWERMNSVVAAIRDVEAAHDSPAHIITVQGTRSWARHLGYYVEHPITGGGGVNIAYETHSYMSPSAFDENWIEPSETLPVIIGEFGPFEMTVDECVVMMDEAESRGIPWLAWTFHQRCGPSLLVDYQGSGCGADMELTPSDDWGVVIYDRLVGQ